VYGAWKRRTRASRQEDSVPGTPRIMVIEHSREHARLVTLALQQDGYEVEALIAPQDVVREVGERRPALVVLDLVPHRSDGFTLLQALTADAIARTVPVVVVTTSADAARTVRDSYHVQAALTKPFELNDLLEAVRRGLSALQTAD
jgi:DNA-binding response OmpR family regulator